MKRKQKDEQHETLTAVVKSRNVWQNGQPLFPQHQRPSWDLYFLAIARAVAARADCRRAQHGAVIVKHNRIISTGYNASPSGGPSCLAGECPRGLLSYEQQPTGAGGSGQDYSNCVACHAELNACIYGNRLEMHDATIYVTGPSCDGCKKAIAAAGIRMVVWSSDGTMAHTEWVSDWIRDWNKR